MADSEDLKIKIGAEDNTKGAIASARGSFGQMTGAIALGTLAADAFKKGLSFVEDQISETIKAAEDEQVAMAKVNGILKTMNGSFDQHKKVVDAAGEAAIKLGFDDEDASISMAKLLQATGDTKTSQLAMTDAMDLARMKNIDLESATQAVTMAYMGNNKMLKQLGIDVPDTATKLDVLGLAHDKLKGQAEAFANTYAGKMEIMKVSMENVREKVGGALLPILTKMFDKILEFVNGDQFQGWLDTLKTFLDEKLIPTVSTLYDWLKKVYDFMVSPWGQAIGIMVGFILVVVGAIKTWTAVQTALNIVMSINPLMLLVAAIGLVIGLVVEAIIHWNNVKKAMMGAWDWVSNLIDKHKTLFTIFAPGLVILQQVVKHWDDIKDAIGDVIEALKSVIHWFEDAWKKVVQFKDATGGAIGKAAGSVGDFFSNLFRADGGSVNANQPYIVGERGAELFIPSSSGTIVPNGQFGSGASIVINLNNPVVREENDITTIVNQVSAAINRSLALRTQGVK